MAAIVPRPGTMDAVILAEMARDPYGVRGHLRAGAVVVDAGANIGAFARLVHSDRPDASVFCIEPMPDNVSALEINLSDCPACTIIAAALVGRGSSIQVHDYGAAASACHSVVDIGIEGVGVVEVRAVTLPGIMEQYGLGAIDFLKLDVQGAEFDIIEHTPTETLSKIAYIAMESHAAIANADTVLGSIPGHRRRLRRMYRKLNQTHVCVRGVPAGGNAILGWANRATLPVREARRHGLRLAFARPALAMKTVVIQIASRIVPESIKRRLRPAHAAGTASS